jgi:hypothetical protein
MIIAGTKTFVGPVLCGEHVMARREVVQVLSTTRGAASLAQTYYEAQISWRWKAEGINATCPDPDKRTSRAEFRWAEHDGWHLFNFSDGDPTKPKLIFVK